MVLDRLTAATTRDDDDYDEDEDTEAGTDNRQRTTNSRYDTDQLGGVVVRASDS